MRDRGGTGSQRDIVSDFVSCTPLGTNTRICLDYVPQAVATDESGCRNETIRTRMVELDFEDPATGSAASSLTSYLSLKGDSDDTKYRITQGVELGRKSDIETHIVSKVGPDGTRAIKEVRLGGTAKVVMKGEIFP